MKKFLSIFLSLCAFSGLSLYTANTVYAGSFGVSPVDLYYEYLKPGGHVEKEISLLRDDTSEDLTIVVEPALGNIDNWFKFEPGREFPFPKGQNRVPLKVIIDVPQDADYQTFEGAIRVRAKSAAEDVPGGVSIVKGARIDVQLVTTKVSFSDLKVRAIKMPDVPQGQPLQVWMRIENLGNTETGPSKVKVTINDLNAHPIKTVETTNVGKVKPNETGEVTAEIPADLAMGEYIGLGEVYLGDALLIKERMVFRVTEALKPVDEQKDGTKAAGLLITDKPGYALLGSGVLGLIIVLGVYLRKRKKKSADEEGQNEETKAAQPRHRHHLLLKLGMFVGLITSTALAALGGMLIASKIYPTDVINDQQIAEVVPSTAPEVQGVETAITEEEVTISPLPTINYQPLIVKAKTGSKKGYPLYVRPDFGSDVVYTAKDGESLNVVDEYNNWYKILLPTNEQAWLPKISVKTATPAEGNN